jgi:hypothetical protein
MIGYTTEACARHAIVVVNDLKLNNPDGRLRDTARKINVTVVDSRPGSPPRYQFST